MKKKLIIITLLLSCFVITGCANNKQKVEPNEDKITMINLIKELNTDRINLSKLENINCPIIEKTKDITFYNMILTEDGILYHLSPYKKFSDGTNCKKVDTEVVFDRYLRDDKLLKSDDKYYRVTYFEEEKKYNIEEFKQYDENIQNYFKEYPNPLFVYLGSKYENGKDIKNYLIVKNDGNIYEEKYSCEWDKCKLLSSNIKYTKEYYDGEIIDIFKANSFSEENRELFTVKTTSGYYENKIVNSCNEYIDVTCEYNLVKNETLNKYKNLIKHFNGYHLIDSNNNIYTRY